MPSWFGKVNFVPYSKASDFTVYLKDGRPTGSICSECGAFSFPTRADCPECLSGSFKFKEITGGGTVYTHSTVAPAPTGFDDMTLGAVVRIVAFWQQENRGGRVLGPENLD
jgi:uncharacterized OB-fold protein